MRTFNPTFLKLLAFTLPMILLSSLNDAGIYLDYEMKEIEYVIKDVSSLQVNGKTNVNTFCCTSQENYDKKSLKYKLSKDNVDILFENAVLTLKTSELDCGKKAINKDMHKTLQADTYPNIILELKEVRNTMCQDLNECNEWVELMAVADITITCYTKTYTFPVTTKKYDEDLFRISGNTELQLCDFEIEPPTALLGLIKVKDGIEINFDLMVELIPDRA